MTRKKLELYISSSQLLTLSTELLKLSKRNGLNMLLQLLPRAGTDSELNSLIVTLI